MRGKKPNLQIIAGSAGPFAVPPPPPAAKPPPKAAQYKGLAPPKDLRLAHRKAWISLISPCSWIGPDDMIKARMLVDLYVEWQRNPIDMKAARLQVLRSLSTDLFESLKRTRNTVRPGQDYSSAYRSAYDRKTT